MEEKVRYAYSEIVEILQQLDYKLVEKVPLNLKNLFTFNALPNYEKHIDLSAKPLSQHNIKPLTKCILAILNYKYWVEDEAHRAQLLELYQNNEKNTKR